MSDLIEMFWKVPFVWRIFLPLILISINLLLAWGVAGYGKVVYNRTKSPGESLNRMRKLLRYLLAVILPVTMLPACYLIFVSLLFVKNDWGDIGIYALVIGSILLMLLVKTCQGYIIHRTVKVIRGTSDPFTKHCGIRLRYHIIIFGPLILIGLGLLMMPREMSRIFWGRKIYFVSLIAAYILFLNFLTPLTVKFVFKTFPLTDPALLTRLQNLFLRAGLKLGKVSVWPAVGSKTANAAVTGLFRGNLFLTDYMMNSLTPEEIEAILAHELGHLKKGHIWSRALLSVLWAPGFLIFDAWATKVRMDFRSPTYLLTIVLLFILYFQIILRLICRVQERQADYYALEIGIESLTMISALYKIGRLNHMKFKQGKLDEKFQNHPSLEHRIKWLMLAGNLTKDSVGSVRESGTDL